MNCVILQPSYIPWRGYFHQIHKADVFVFYDDVQYDDEGWRNRNRVKGPNGNFWLTVPVHHRRAIVENAPINSIRICWDSLWNAKHWRSLAQAYAKAPFFKEFAGPLERFFSERWELLADFTIELTIAVAQLLGISETRYLRSSALPADGAKTDRLVSILKAVGATHYISGPSAKDYLEERKLADAGITLEYMTYDYPEYPQLYQPFDPHVSVLDLLFMVGPDAGRYIWK